MTIPEDKYFRIDYNENSKLFVIADTSVSYNITQAIEMIEQFHIYVQTKVASWCIGDDPMPRFATIQEIELMNTHDGDDSILRRCLYSRFPLKLSKCQIRWCNNYNFRCNTLCGSTMCIYDTLLDHYEMIYNRACRRALLLVFLHGVKNTEKIQPWMPGNKVKNFMKMISSDSGEHLKRQIGTFA